MPEAQSGRDVDALVAKVVIGWTWNERSAFHPNGGAYSTHKGPWDWLPYYSTDEGAAWEVVRAIKEPDVFCEIYSGVPEPASRYDPAQMWTCRFVRDGMLMGYGAAESPALAICIAALRARNINI